MKPIELRRLIGHDLFTHDALSFALAPHYTNVNAKISSLVSHGVLYRLKRGVYCFSKAYGGAEPDRITVANMLYAPSYVSFEYALSFHEMIPERVHEVTSACRGRGKVSKEFNTPVGRFSYRAVPARAYSIGIDWLFDRERGGRLIATPEKALCDKVRADKGMRPGSQRGMLEYLEKDLRIDMDRAATLDTTLIREIAIAYRSDTLRELGAAIAKRSRK